jgi:hypothetical protein
VIFFESAKAVPAVKKSSTERTATSATEQDPFIAPPSEFEISTAEATAISGDKNLLPVGARIGDLDLGVKEEVSKVSKVESL